MKDYLVAFDAPIGNEMSRMTIAEAERRFPGKPFKYLVLTHHHMDHVNGARVFAAKGADLAFGPGDREMFAQQMQAPNRIRNDELWRHPRTVGLTEVKDRLTLTDGQREIDLHVIDNSHAKGIIFAYYAVDISAVLSSTPPIFPPGSASTLARC
jgi:glyoxylase-like metal-dependent hydrolase (beta-lactamase superfamily II)